MSAFLECSYLFRGQNRLSKHLFIKQLWGTGSEPGFLHENGYFFGLTLFCHWFHQLVIFRNKFFLILTQPDSFYTPPQINTCLNSSMKILGESTTFGQR